MLASGVSEDTWKIHARSQLTLGQVPAKRHVMFSSHVHCAVLHSGLYVFQQHRRHCLMCFQVVKTILTAKKTNMKACGLGMRHIVQVNKY